MLARTLVYIGVAQTALSVLISILPRIASHQAWTADLTENVRLLITAFIGVFSMSTALGNNELEDRLNDEIRACKTKLALSAAHGLLADALSLNRERVGLHVYVVRRRMTAFFRARQIRFAHHRAKRNPNPELSHKWPRGVGVVGRCWAADDQTVTWLKVD